MKTAHIVLLAVVLAGAGHAASVAEYNVVWDSPSKDSSGSMPIGNGDIGANVWVEPNGDLVLLLSKTDAWSENGRILKLGRVRITCEPALLGPGTEFKQTLDLKTGSIRIGTSNADTRTSSMEVFIDANHPVVRVAVESDPPRKITAQHETWRAKRRKVPAGEWFSFYGLMTRGGGTWQEGPVHVEADTVESNQTDRIVFYHRNTRSIWAGNLRLQGLGSLVEKGTDPLLNRTFGGIVKAEGMVNTAANRLETSEPKTKQLINIFAHTALTDTAPQWVEQVESKIGRDPPLSKARSSHQAWWDAFWNRSWIHVSRDQSADGRIIPESRHTIRMGQDQSGANRYRGEIGRVSFYRKALTAPEIAALAGDDRAVLKGRAGLVKSWTDVAVGTELDDVTQQDLAGSVSMEAWVEPAGGTARIIDMISPSGQDGFLLDTFPGNSLRFIVGHTSIGKSHCLSAGEWSHIAAVADAQSRHLSVYVNGSVVAEADLAQGDDAFVVARAYALQRWINACAGRGNSPIKFNGSIFTVESGYDADWRRWGPCYWWQNTRLPYWAMGAAGDYDMLRPLFKMYMDTLPFRKDVTRLYYDHEGAFYPETMNFWGTYSGANYGWGPQRKGLPVHMTQNRHIRYEWQGGIEVLSMMLDYHAHVQDREFLETVLLPFAKEITSFYDRHYPLDENGTLNMYPCNALEDVWDCRDPADALGGLRSVLPRLVQLSEDPSRKDGWTGLLKKLPALPKAIDGNGVAYLLPAGQGRRRGNGEKPEMYALFPYRLFGVGMPDLQVIKETYVRSPKRGYHGGWSQNSIFNACLGHTREARDVLVRASKTWHRGSRFPAFWGPNYDWIPDQDHGGVIMITLQKMVMQCYGDKIHIAPAWPKDWKCEFKLHAPGNTTVEGKVMGGKVVDLKVTPERRRTDVVMVEEDAK